MKIPYEISAIAVKYSIPFMYISAQILFIYRERVLAFLQFVVYTTSVIYWSNIDRNGIIRYIDMGCSFVLLLSMTYYITKLKKFYHYIWYYSIGSSICIFIMNEYAFLYGMEHYIDEKLRTYIAYQSIIIHIYFIHILPIFTGLFCMIMSK